MIIENGMVAGYGYHNIPFEDDPAQECASCRMNLYEGDKVFDWDGDEVCGECLVENINKLSLQERAEMTGESIAYTEQALDDAYTADQYAEILNIESRYIGE